MRQGIADVRGAMRSLRSLSSTAGSTNRPMMEGWQRILRNSTAGQGFPASPKASNVRGGLPSRAMNASSPIGANTMRKAAGARCQTQDGDSGGDAQARLAGSSMPKIAKFRFSAKIQCPHSKRTFVRIKSGRDKIRGELFTMSQREGINLLCTNRGLISPLRVCVRAGGVAPRTFCEVPAPGVRVCVRAGGAA